MAKVYRDQEGTPEETINPGDTGSSEVVVTTEVKKVRIQVVEPVDCLIAQVAYILERDKQYTVLPDVAAILCNSRKAYRL